MDNELEVLGLHLLYDRIIIVQEESIFIFVLTDLTMESSIETFKNKEGICQVGSSPEPDIPSIVLFPGGLKKDKHRVSFRFATNTSIMTFPLPIFYDVYDEVKSGAKLENTEERHFEKKEYAHTDAISALAI